MDEKYYIYVIVRKDISPEQQAVQACHAASEAGEYEECKGATLVLLDIKDEEALINFGEQMVCLGITIYPFYEPDIGGRLTAIATKPLREEQRYIFKELKTLRFPKGILYHLKVFWRSIKRELTE